MLYIKRLLILSLLIPVSQAICASSKPLPGYFIANNGDSVHCNIEYGDWYKNPETIQVEINNEKRTLGVTDIKGFGVFGYYDYKTAVVTYHVNPINGTDLPSKFSDSVITKAIFLKVLIKGIYTLYELEVTERVYYFVQKNDGAISELLYRVAVQDGEIKEDKQYANTIAGLFLGEEILDHYRGNIYGASYNSDIISLIKILNEKYTGIKTRKTASAEFQADVFAGGIINFFPSTINGMFPAYNKMKSSNSFSGGVNLVYIVAGHFKAFKLGLSIGYDHYNSTGTKTDSIVDRADPNDWKSTVYTENLSVTNTMIMANLHATYTINPTDNIKFYLKAGFSYSFGKKNVYVLDDYKTTVTGFNSGNTISGGSQGTEKAVALSNGLPNPNVGAGIETGRHKLEFSYYFPLNAGLSSSDVFKIGMAGVYYYFTILK